MNVSLNLQNIDELSCCGIDTSIYMYPLPGCLFSVGCFDIISKKINTYGSSYIAVFVVNCVTEVNKWVFFNWQINVWFMWLIVYIKMDEGMKLIINLKQIRKSVCRLRRIVPKHVEEKSSYQTIFKKKVHWTYIFKK